MEPIEKHELLAEKARLVFKEGAGVAKRTKIKIELEKLLASNWDDFCKATSTSKEDIKLYEVNDRDAYLLLSPSRGKKNNTLSQRKFEFFWYVFDMDSYNKQKEAQKTKHYFYDALQSFIYKGNTTNGDLMPGHYLLKRMSLNSDFKGHMVTIRLWVYEDTNAFGEKVLAYKAINEYNQDGTIQDSFYKRLRISEGYVVRNQYNTLLIGSVDYSHLSETEGRDATNYYPEIISLHTASPNSKVFIGFSLANYPDYKKPAVTQCYIETQDGFDLTFEEYKSSIKSGEVDDLIGIRKPTEKELTYLSFVINDTAHKNILIPEKSSIYE